MDIVYICRAGDNEELRYSIRSVVKNLKHDKIWVVGGKPKWYKGNFISVPTNKTKYSNARANMEVIANSAEISDDFILMNDDFYIMKPLNTVEYYYSEPLVDKVKVHENLFYGTAYTNMLSLTLNKLNKLDIQNPLSYEVHVPFVMNKEKLKPILKHKRELWRSMYGNLYNVGGKQIEDVKVYPRTSYFYGKFNWEKNLDKFISSQDESFLELKTNLLDTKFPKKTIYEN